MNQKETLDSFIHAFEKVAEILREKDPDVILAPMMGAVPFIDILNIIDDEFPNEKVIYVPASSRLHKVSKVLRETFRNIIEDYTPNGGKFISLDEVVSGNSCIRVYKQFENAVEQYALERNDSLSAESDLEYKKQLIKKTKDSIEYHIIGIVDSKMDRQGKSKVKEYNKMLDDGLITPVNTHSIITMDKVQFIPFDYKSGYDSEGREIHLPVVDKLRISPEYIGLLKSVAERIGKNPDNVTVMNIAKITDSYKHVPEYMRNV